jgi:hypothetical protein
MGKVLAIILTGDSWDMPQTRSVKPTTTVTFESSFLLKNGRR